MPLLGGNASSPPPHLFKQRLYCFYNKTIFENGFNLYLAKVCRKVPAGEILILASLSPLYTHTC